MSNINSPPVEHQWKKGQSGNPAGRPPKKRLSDVLDQMDPATAIVLKLNKQVITRQTPEGKVERLTRYESLLERLFQLGMQGNVKALMHSVKINQDAQNKQSEIKANMYKAALAHRDRYLQVFLDAEKNKKPRPDIWPDPRDYQFHADGTVTCDGPQCLADQIAMQEVISERDKANVFLAEAEAGWLGTGPEVVAHIKSLEKSRNILNTLLPPRLRTNALPLVPRFNEGD